MVQIVICAVYLGTSTLASFNQVIKSDEQGCDVKCGGGDNKEGSIFGDHLAHYGIRAFEAGDTTNTKDIASMSLLGLGDGMFPIIFIATRRSNARLMAYQKSDGRYGITASMAKGFSSKQSWNHAFIKGSG